MTKPRSTAIFGSVIRIVPSFSNDHGFSRSASLAPAIAARASAACRSKVATSSAVSAGVGGGAIGLPPGAMSSSSRLMVIGAQEGRFARWPASQIIVPDFGCGRQSNLSAGTRSSVLRAPAISWSNSGSRLSPMAMSSSLAAPRSWRPARAGSRRRRNRQSSPRS